MHYFLDEKPLIAAGTPIDLNYPPGSGGNPAPPGGSVSGTGDFWYLGQIRMVLAEAKRLGYKFVFMSEVAQIAGRGV